MYNFADLSPLAIECRQLHLLLVGDVIIGGHTVQQQLALEACLLHVHEMLALLLISTGFQIVSIQQPLHFFRAEPAQRVPVRLAYKLSSVGLGVSSVGLGVSSDS